MLATYEENYPSFFQKCNLPSCIGFIYDCAVFCWLLVGDTNLGSSVFEFSLIFPFFHFYTVSQKNSQSKLFFVITLSNFH